MKKRLNSTLYLKFFSKREDSLKIFFVSLQRLGGSRTTDALALHTHGVERLKQIR